MAERRELLTSLPAWRLRAVIVLSWKNVAKGWEDFAVTWKKADVVRLNSSGPKGPNMTVLDVSDNGVRCCWIDKSDKPHDKVFPDEALIEGVDASNIHIVHRDETLEQPVVDRLMEMRGPNESLSDVVLRLIELEAKPRPT
jgi:uncharacterized protein YodC (DUF2158 family)